MKAFFLSPVLNNLLNPSSLLRNYRIKTSENSDRYGDIQSFNNTIICHGFSLL